MLCPSAWIKHDVMTPTGCWLDSPDVEPTCGVGKIDSMLSHCRDIPTIVHIVSSPHRDNDHNHHFYMLPWYPYHNSCYSIAGNENLHIISEPLIKMSPSRCTVIHHHHCDKPGASLWGDTSRPEQLKTNLGVNEPWKIKWTFNSARKHHIFFIIFIFFLEGNVSWIWSKTAFYLVNL